MEDKQHLSEEGLNLIKSIKLKMNKKRRPANYSSQSEGDPLDEFNKKKQGNQQET